MFNIWKSGILEPQNPEPHITMEDIKEEIRRLEVDNIRRKALENQFNLKFRRMIHDEFRRVMKNAVAIMREKPDGSTEEVPFEEFFK